MSRRATESGRDARRYSIRCAGESASGSSGKLIVSGHDHYGVFDADTDELVFAPPHSVALTIAGEVLVSWRLDRREGESGVARGDFDWTIELYSWPEDPAFQRSYVMRSRKTIENCWPDALACPKSHHHRVCVVKSRSEDHRDDVFVVMHADGTFSETYDRKAAVALAANQEPPAGAEFVALRVPADRLPLDPSRSALARALARYLAALRELGFVPALCPSVSGDALEKLEASLERPLPDEFAELLSIANGETDADGSAFGGFTFLSTTRIGKVLEEWAEIRRAQGPLLDAKCTCDPDAAIRREYSNAGWLPFAKEPLEPNFVALDLAPGPNGKLGQVITFGRDERKKSVLFPSLAEFFEWLASEAECGHFRVATAGELAYVEHRLGRLPQAILRARAASSPLG